MGYSRVRILIVEDEAHVSSQLTERLGKLNPSIDTVVAGSRASGIEALKSDEFDFIVCDLRLPPHDGGIDSDEAHGLAVYSEARNVCPGTPCLFFTGFGSSPNVLEQLSAGGTHDVLGIGESYPMTRLLTKDEFRQCVHRIESFNTELANLEAIRVDFSNSNSSLDHIERRALQLRARSLGGTSIEASELGGLSGARTLRARVKDDQGRTLDSYFAKIDLWARMRRERENYHRYVNPLLKMGGYPALGLVIEAGIGKREALFYQLADEYTRNLFDVLEGDESAAIAIVGLLRDIFDQWAVLREKKVLSTYDLRAQCIGDSEFQPHRDALDSTEIFEEIEQEMVKSCQHGDLHGLNVLCNDSGGAVVIDFGNVGCAPSCSDPILLELSVLFHKDSPFRCISWPTNEQTDAWFNLDEYLLGCPFPKFIRKCREWAIEIGGPADLPPVVYAEAVRQLKYQDTNHERASRIARSAIRTST